MGFRDLKPENVMLDQRGYVRLIDFGLARRLETPFSPRFTLVGTPEFLSPEVLTGGGYTTQADIWALGVLAYELLVGKLPFLRSNPHGREDQLLLQSIIFAEPDLPEWLDAASASFLRCCLKKL